MLMTEAQCYVAPTEHQHSMSPGSSAKHRSDGMQGLPAALLKINGQDIWQIFIGSNYMAYVMDRAKATGLEIAVVLQAGCTAWDSEESVNRYLHDAMGVPPEDVWFVATATEAMEAFREALPADGIHPHVSIQVPSV